MSLTTDPKDPDLGRGADIEQVPQNKKYLVLSEDERTKGFVRPVRREYVHVGLMPKNPLRPLTEDQKDLGEKYDYVMYEEYPEGSHAIGRYWTQKDLDSKGCGTVTAMAIEIAETYARNPHFYGATYCLRCMKHLPVEEFVWKGTDEKVGS